jgi:hypothetical protein
MFAPVFAVLLAFLASVSATDVPFNNCFAAAVNHFNCKGTTAVSAGNPHSPQSCANACVAAQNPNAPGYEPYLFFSYTSFYGNCLCAKHCDDHSDYHADVDSYCINSPPPPPPQPFILCGTGHRCGLSVTTQANQYLNVEACANQCRTAGGFTYFNYVADTKQCQCATTCSSPTNYLEQTGSDAYQLDAGVCTHGGAGRLRVR